MIAACPECRTPYRVDPERLSAEGVRLRCTRCQTIFRVRAPKAGAAPAPEPAAPPAPAPDAPSAPDAAAPPPVPRASAASRVPEAPERPPVAEAPAPPPVAEVPPPGAPGSAPPPAPDPTPGGEPGLAERLVLVATPDVAQAKSWADALRDWGLEAETASDGVEAILKIQRRLPRAVVLDPQLPKMFGFQVCELMKRNESLRRIGVVLIGAIHHPERYRRGPSELYGADAYVEAPDLPGALAPLLRDLGLPLGPGAERSGAATGPSAPEPLVSPPAPEPPPADVAPFGSEAGPPGPEVAPPMAGLEPPVAEVEPPMAEVEPPVAELAPPAPEAPPTAVPEPPPLSISSDPSLSMPPQPRPAEMPPVEPPQVVETPEYAEPPPVPDPPAPPQPMPEPPAAPSPPPVPESPSAATAPPAPEPAATAPAAGPGPGGEADPDVARAERLARIIVSDVVLYNEEKFNAAVASGNVVEAMEPDLADGRAHFAQRIPEGVRAGRDFLAEELVRVARSRGMAG